MRNLCITAILCVACVTGAFAQTSLLSDATSVRASAILTTADVLSTTVSLDQRVKAVYLYANVTIGNLNSVVLTPAGAMDDNPVAASYYGVEDQITTVSQSGRFVIRVPRENFGAYKYVGVKCRGSGTVDNSLLQVSYKLEY